ncbi:MAG: cytochrome c maturation protein CcmE [Chloroflexota bacterium]|nr:cytochrome c maturation protein CcmE [Chloroflexota bacterium]
MAQAAWEKPVADAPSASGRDAGKPAAAARRGERLKFLIGGLLMVGAVIFLIAQGMSAGARFFITVEETVSDPAYLGQSVRVSGAVIGETIRYDAENLIIEFEVAHVPDNIPNAGEALHQAANDPNATRMRVRVENQVKPELLQHEAQAIMTGSLDENGVFHATELNLKCPSRFIEGTVPSLGQSGT